MSRYARASALVLVAVIALAVRASPAWSRADASPIGDEQTGVTCVESYDGAFCLCRPGADVCAGERAVGKCEARAEGSCCVSPAGFCYCTAEAHCTFPEDVPADRCDTGAGVAPPGPRLVER
jgi:hypothetical protein